MNVKNDLTGKIYGKLTVISFSHKAEKYRVNVWNCKCDCGKETKVWSTALNRTHRPTESCGCNKHRHVKENGAYNRLSESEANLRSLIGVYKKSSKERGISFDLTNEEFKKLVSKNCYYCDTKPKQIHKKMDTYGELRYNGIDRVDSDLSYNISNCVTCCKTCNYAKRLMTKKEFKNWIEKVYHNFVKEEL